MNNVISVEHKLGDRILKLETGLLAKQAHGAVVVTLGDTVVLATATMGLPREGVDFFPLLVDFEERYYASGKIKGSRFVKREGMPSENAILTARLIDRPLRPLFPKGMVNDVQIVCTVLSADLQVDPDTLSMIGASAALMISGMPFSGPVAGVRIGYMPAEDGKNQFILNPTYQQVEQGLLDLVVGGTKDAITMVEAGAKQIPEEIILEALSFAHNYIREICIIQEEFKKKITVPPREFVLREENKELIEKIEHELTEEQLNLIQGETKADVKERMHALEKEVFAKYTNEIEKQTYRKNEIVAAVEKAIDKHMRKNILQHKTRLDGRKLDQIRPISCRASILPRTHGSALFQRGETQALSIVTLGAPSAAQIIDTMDQDTTKRYMHFYNFPPYSTGEVKPLRGASRREVGHGNLAERALLPVIPSKEQFAYTILVVSEICTCNGSSSMASVCGSTMALMDAGVPILEPVSGIAMGLITGEQGNYRILTDIQGLEDFSGDMDFKVAGTKNGITALQMDIKVSGLSLDIMREALTRAKNARAQVLSDMLAVLSAPRPKLSPFAPLLITMKIDTDHIRMVIGKGGETIQKIIAETGTTIDIEDDGVVTITANDQESGQKAIKMIQDITYVPKVGDVFQAKVVKIMEFGAFVEFMPHKEGLVHISELAPIRINRVEDVVKLGDIITVKLIKIDEQGRYNLSHKATLLPKKNNLENRSAKGVQVHL